MLLLILKHAVDALGFPGGARGRESTCQGRRQKRCGFHPWDGNIPWRRAQQPTPVFLPEESQGQRHLAGYSPWGRKELDTTEHTGMWTLQMLVKRYSSTSWPRCSTGMQPAWPCLGCPGFCLHPVVPHMHVWLHRDPGQSRSQKMIGQKTKDV